MSVKVKICCISSLNEAKLAINAGADILGLVARMPSGPGVISDQLIAEIASQISLPTKTFLLSSETKAQKIIEHHQLVRTCTIQIVDSLSDGNYAALRASLPGIELVQVIHVIDEKSIEQALAVAPQVDYLLLDSGNPKLKIKELGGTGRTHNWALSRSIVDQSPIPVFLAGGLNASNVQQAMQEVQAYGLDLCSGVRTNGQLDVQKLNDFFTALGQ